MKISAETMARLDRIASIDRDMGGLSSAYVPLCKRFLALHKNLLLSGWDRARERIVLTLHKAEWPTVAGYGYDRTDRLLGMDVRWI